MSSKMLVEPVYQTIACQTQKVVSGHKSSVVLCPIFTDPNPGYLGSQVLDGLVRFYFEKSGI